ncbi:MAG: ATP-binding cassette domain-containing protein [Bacteroides sp.]|nr:ATP-binding cassette domain-containing protein [Prevotella sp.]MCM1406881.1 ATP-binding cassette domain-containing protein [Treponema brennaborense]MCM1470032.1 ATP-binding cassette domain-containing protein [Bacteroides sp.]
MKRFFLYLKTRPLALFSVCILAVLYIVMLFAEFIAPYAPTTTFETMTYHPPTVRIARGGESGTFGLKMQEARVINSVTWKYARIKGLYRDIRFFARGERYLLWGIIPCDRHLFCTLPDENGRTYPVFLLGADHLGRDMFSRVVYGSRISLTIGFIATIISLLLAVLFGGFAGYYGGRADWFIMRLSEFFMLIPGLYLILFLRSLLSNSMDSGQSYMVITLILSLVGWPGSARTIRGLTHAIKREEFVLNAQLEGIPAAAIIFKYILPQTASLLIVSTALSIPGFIMSETTLSYLGLGIADPAVSWGSLIRRDISTLANLRNYPWLLNPVWLLLTVTLAFNFTADALRDFFDPYHSGTCGISAARILHRLVRRLCGTKRRAEKHGGSGSSDCAENTAEDSAGKSAQSESGTRGSGTILSVRNLHVSFPMLRGTERIVIQAVRGVSFDMRRGEILGIVGESGSGKSAATSAILGLLPPHARVCGTIAYTDTGGSTADLVSLQNDARRRKKSSSPALRAVRGRRIGMIFQEQGRSFDPLQSIGSMFFETFRNSDPAITKREAAEKAAALLEETGIPRARERLSGYPHQFSGGQLQRIGIALALAQNCELLIADEPTTALDVTIQLQIVNLLKKLRETRNLSIIFISHNIDLVTEISDRIMVMYGGLIMEIGSAQKIRQPLNPYTQALFAAAPAFGSHYSKTPLASIPGKVPDPAQPPQGCPFSPRCPHAEKDCAQELPILAETKTEELSYPQDCRRFRLCPMLRNESGAS